ncbi:MAG: hypothetical protein ACPH5K_09780, partial [Polaribacter sp.]
GRLPPGKQSLPSLLEKISGIKKLQHASAEAFAQVSPLGRLPPGKQSLPSLLEKISPLAVNLFMYSFCKIVNIIKPRFTNL